MRRVEPGHSESGATTTTPQSAPPLRPPRPVRVLSGAAAVAAILLIAVLAAKLFGSRGGSSGRPPIPSVLTIDLAKDKLDCASGLAWSPDGTRLAFFARKDTCASGITVLAIYDARTGQRLRTIEIDPLLARLGVTGYVTSATWAPDGKTLAIPIAPDFNWLGVFLGSPFGISSSRGLLLAPVEGDAARFIATPSADQIRPFTDIIWDVSARKVASVASQPLPLALNYRWTADGHLEADTPLPDNPAPGTFSGSPTTRVGATTISRWHAGTITYIGSPRSQGQPVTWYLSSWVPAWSPDGHFFTVLHFNTRLNAPGTAPAPLDPALCGDGFTDVCTQPAIALPDRAFAAVLAADQVGVPASIGGTTTRLYLSFVSVDWRPDGKALAAILPMVDSSGIPLAMGRVTLFSTATGQPLAVVEVTPAIAEGGLRVGGVPSTFWSPDGRQLAYAELESPRITILGASGLTALPG